MKVFLSWSGEQSRLVATALREWLPQVINAVEPFISSDIDAGARWQSDVANELETTDFGIVCVTAENQGASWLNFEAGALAKKVGAGRVVPLAINLSPAEILLPLAQFQAQPLTEMGMGKIVTTINTALPTSLSTALVEKAVSKWWPELESEVQQIQEQLSQDVIEAPVRTDRELIEETLSTVRDLARSPSQITINIQGSRLTPLSMDEKTLIQMFNLAENAVIEVEGEGVESRTRPGLKRVIDQLNILESSRNSPKHDRSSDE